METLHAGKNWSIILPTTTAELELASEQINRRGHITVLGKAGIHRIENVSVSPSKSIHVYGVDVGNAERHSFNPVTGEISRFVSGYCNVLREEDLDYTKS